MATRAAQLIYSLLFRGFIWGNSFLINLCGDIIIINLYGNIIINCCGNTLINFCGNIINFDYNGKP